MRNTQTTPFDLFSLSLQSHLGIFWIVHFTIPLWEEKRKCYFQFSDLWKMGAKEYLGSQQVCRLAIVRTRRVYRFRACSIEAQRKLSKMSTVPPCGRFVFSCFVLQVCLSFARGHCSSFFIHQKPGNQSQPLMQHGVGFTWFTANEGIVYGLTLDACFQSC